MNTLLTIIKKKTKGNLSFVMLLLQTPGALIMWIYYLIGNSWSVWLSSFVTLIELSILFVLVVYYDYFKPPFSPLRKLFSYFNSCKKKPIY